MVATDWRRSVGSAGVMACIRREVMKSDEAGLTMVSFEKTAFPKLAQYVARYRNVVDYKTGGSSVRAVVDLIVLGKGRTEISLILTTRYADRAQADLFERALAKLLVSRISA
jgi:hypothetical protein